MQQHHQGTFAIATLEDLDIAIADAFCRRLQVCCHDLTSTFEELIETDGFPNRNRKGADASVTARTTECGLNKHSAGSWDVIIF